jgi:hypothetical protein
MAETNPFLAATKQKLRFVTTGGHFSVEDLWDLSLKDLDRIAVKIDEGLSGSRKSFLENPDSKATAAKSDDELRLEILKGVIETKQNDNKAKKAATDKASQKAFLTNLLAQKKMNQLESQSLEEIEKQLAALEAE